MEEIENPFLGVGSVVYDEQFIGRESSLQLIDRMITIPKRILKAIAIVGYPRIGKTSLAYHSIECRKDKLLATKKIPIWINFGTYKHIFDFFQDLVRQALKKFNEIQLKDSRLEDSYKKVFSYQNSPDSWTGFISELRCFFEWAAGTGYQLIYVLDEFDSARILFHQRHAELLAFRDLASLPQFKMTFMTISRRSVREIELKALGIPTGNSVLDLVIQKKEYLKMYQTSELSQYFKLYNKIGFNLTPPQKKRIEYYCGGHPFLLASLGLELVEAFKSGLPTDVDVIFKRSTAMAFDNYYKQLVELLKEDGTYQKMLEIIFGPIETVTQETIDELCVNYTLLKPNPNLLQLNDLIAFSEHFTEYLRHLRRKEAFWPIWAELEVKMREIITSVFKRRYRTRWFDVITERHRDFCEKAIQLRQIAERREDSTIDNLLYYFDAQPLFEVILNTRTTDPTDRRTSWDLFREDPNNKQSKPIFGDKSVFTEKMKDIMLIRNPYAHNRFETIKPTTLDQVVLDCRKLIGQIDNYWKEIK